MNFRANTIRKYLVFRGKVLLQNYSQAFSVKFEPHLGPL